MRMVKLWCYVVVFFICQCDPVLCTGVVYSLEDGPYFSIQYCYSSNQPVLSCTRRGYNTIQIIDVSLEKSARENCWRSKEQSSMSIRSTISDEYCHWKAVQILHTVCGNKRSCKITWRFTFNLRCGTRYDYAWITYKCHQEDNVPQAVILCKKQTVITQQMCQPGTVIETIGAMFADELGLLNECDCCSLFGDCFLDVDNGTMVAILAACEGKQTCDELKLSVPTELVTCGGRVYIDYTAIYYRCIAAKKTTPMSGRKDLHQGSNLGVAVGVPAAVFLLAIVVVAVVMVLIVRRRRQKKAGKAATHLQSEGASAEDNATYVNQGHGVHFHAGTIAGDNHRDSAIENEYIVFEETVSPSKDNHPEQALDNKAYYRPEGSVAQAATIQEDGDSSNPYELTLTDNQLYDFNDDSEEKGDRGGATKLGPLNDVYTLAEPRGGKAAQPEETVLDQTPLKNTNLGPVTGEIYSLPITHDVEMLDNDAYAT